MAATINEPESSHFERTINWKGASASKTFEEVSYSRHDSHELTQDIREDIREDTFGDICHFERAENIDYQILVME